MFAAYRTAMKPSLNAYLRDRLTGFDLAFSAPWPAVVWAVELAAAWLAGVAVAGSFGGPSRTTPTQTETT